ncbi:hypothetical protein Rhal01_02059 [Rubritalea halochordaticola]|uniref:Uncharacterized protein n=1 Tax=Rubritalea halochordaticola TaxID=714537 RepID=A0ABP9UZK9_9BACT
MKLLMMWMLCMLAATSAMRSEMKDLEGEWVLDKTDMKLLEKKVMELVRLSEKQRKIEMGAKQAEEMASSLIDYLAGMKVSFHREEDGKWFYSMSDENEWQEYVLTVIKDGDTVSCVTDEGAPIVIQMREGGIFIESRTKVPMPFKKANKGAGEKVDLEGSWVLDTSDKEALRNQLGGLIEDQMLQNGIAREDMAEAKKTVFNVLLSQQFTFTKKLGGKWEYLMEAGLEISRSEMTVREFSNRFICKAANGVRVVILKKEDGGIDVVNPMFDTPLPYVRSKMEEAKSILEGHVFVPMNVSKEKVVSLLGEAKKVHEDDALDDLLIYDYKLTEKVDLGVTVWKGKVVAVLYDFDLPFVKTFKEARFLMNAYGDGKQWDMKQKGYKYVRSDGRYVFVHSTPFKKDIASIGVASTEYLEALRKLENK